MKLDILTFFLCNLFFFDKYAYMGTIFKNNQKTMLFTDHKNNVFFKLKFGIHRYSKRSFYKSYCTVQLKHESPKLYLIENKLAYASNSSEEMHMFSSKPKSLPRQNVGVTWLPVMKEPYDTRFWRISGFPSGAFSCHLCWNVWTSFSQTLTVPNYTVLCPGHTWRTAPLKTSNFIKGLKFLKWLDHNFNSNRLDLLEMVRI